LWNSVSITLIVFVCGIIVRYEDLTVLNVKI